MDIFKDYIWYGNLREMKNVVKRSTLLTDSEYVEVKSLPFEIVNYYKLNPISDIDQDDEELPEIFAREKSTASGMDVLRNKTAANLNLKNASLDAEFETIMEALKKVNFNKSKAAQLLNIDRKTLYNKMKEYQLINSKADD